MSNRDEELAVRVERLEAAFRRLEHDHFYDRAAVWIGNGLLPEEEILAARFVASTNDGWLVTKIQGARVSLPSALRVDMRSTTSGRDYGKVLEGVLAGADFDVTSGNLSNSYERYKNLVAKLTTRTGGPVVEGGETYHLSLDLAYQVDGENRKAGPFPAKVHPQNPVPHGWHDLEIPDFPHELGAGYGNYGTTWFRIGHSGDRYLHPGRVSAGCVTCAPSWWNAIYSIVHRCRHTDTLSVGQLHIS